MVSVDQLITGIDAAVYSGVGNSGLSRLNIGIAEGDSREEIVAGATAIYTTLSPEFLRAGRDASGREDRSNY
jgi:hypothetical protein